MPARRPAIDPLVLVDALPQAVLVLDDDLAIRGANAAAETLLDRGIAALEGLELARLLGPGHPVIEVAELALASGSTASKYEVELELPGSDGAHRVDAVAVPLEDGSSRNVILTLAKRPGADLIERRLAHRSSARSLGGMASLLAHEIKNPLSGIRGAAQLLETAADEAGLEMTALIITETDRIAGLIDRMEAFGSRAGLRREPVNIHEVLDHVRQIARSGFARHIRFVEDYDPSLPPVPGDRDSLIQAVLNLVKNAAEAIGERRRDGVITLRTAFRPGPRIKGGRAAPLLVTIEDNGPGIAEDVRAHLFQAFLTTKPRGTGLGLALVAKIAEEHGGMVDLDSAPGRTRFRLALPIAKEHSGP
jgi:two-component system nitrogen regulation sensor histidine kinase GlnL